MKTEMPKRSIYLFLGIVVVILVAVFFYFNAGENITGKISGSIHRTCVDSDGGDEKYVKGEVTFTVYDRATIKKDTCFSPTGAVEKWLKEYYCDVYYNVGDRDYNCKEGCKDGACIKKVIPCEDSDAGLDYAEKGKACSETECKEDKCLDEKYLSEAYCSEGVKQEIYRCQDNCEEGKCIEPAGNVEEPAEEQEEEVAEEEVLSSPETEKEAGFFKKLLCRIKNIGNNEEYLDCIFN